MTDEYRSARSALRFLAARSRAPCLLAFSSADEAAAERRRLRIEPPLHALRCDGPARPRDLGLPDTTSALVGPRLSLHMGSQSLIRSDDLEYQSPRAPQSPSVLPRRLYLGSSVPHRGTHRRRTVVELSTASIDLGASSMHSSPASQTRGVAETPSHRAFPGVAASSFVGTAGAAPRAVRPAIHGRNSDMLECSLLARWNGSADSNVSSSSKNVHGIDSCNWKSTIGYVF